MQDDIVHEDLTVRENLEYSAWLRNPKYMRTRAKGDLVDDVIDVLNLRSVQHSVVGTAEKRGIRWAHPFGLPCHEPPSACKGRRHCQAM